MEERVSAIVHFTFWSPLDLYKCKY